MNRRDFLSAALLAPALARLQPLPGGQFLGTVPFGRPGGRVAPLNRLIGEGLDARLFTDLSTIRAEQLTTPADGFFVRTAATAALPPAERWTIAVGGLVKQKAAIGLAALQQEARPLGRCLMECAGNADPLNYGLMSVADWDGVPLPALLDRLQ